MFKKTALAMALLLGSASTWATPLTTTSLTSGGTVNSGISEVGGIVFDLIGTNGTRITSQLSASSLYAGYFGSSYGDIGSQSGFDSSVYSALGGGISEASVRISVSDGDTSPSDFDYQENDLIVNGVDFGDFSLVLTDETNSTGLTQISQQFGFSDSEFNTGWFFLNDAVQLSTLYNSIVTTEAVKFQLYDIDPSDNYFDFTQGVDNSLINIGSGPVVTPGISVPEPSSLVLFGLALAGFSLRKKKKNI
ncbi:MAG: PEP-CTERM sorting domain-containing protein [Colwellia sp.]